MIPYFWDILAMTAGTTTCPPAIRLAVVTGSPKFRKKSVGPTPSLNARAENSCVRFWGLSLTVILTLFLPEVCSGAGVSVGSRPQEAQVAAPSPRSSMSPPHVRHFAMIALILLCYRSSRPAAQTLQRRASPSTTAVQPSTHRYTGPESRNR